jgi:uncharacterized protein (DUF1697 family)
MADKKTILEEALLDIKNIQNALNANTKEILRSVAKEEIDSVVKESLLKEDEFEEEDLDAMPTDSAEPVAGEPVADAGLEIGGGEESEGGLDDIKGSEVAPEASPAMDVATEPELGMDAPVALGEPEMDLDMTAASDDDVIAIYKKLSGNDEIEIVGDEIHLNISEPGEYVVKTNAAKLGDESAPIDTPTDAPTDLVPAGAEGGEETGVDYEIEMGDEEPTGGETSIDDLVPAGEEGGEESGEEEQLDEKIKVGIGMSVGKHANLGNAPKGAGANESKLNRSKLVSEIENKYKAVLTESNKLKAENAEFRKALKEFRTKLVETVVFNSNLTYVTRLLMEHSTTKAEKQNIIKRFDEEVSNLIESKRLYKTIASGLESRKPITEAVESKIMKEVTSGASKQLNESTAYVDPSTKRIIDLIKRVERNNNN